MSRILEALYASERARLLTLADADAPAGEYRTPVFGAGDRHAPVVLIGEAPGAEESRQGVPFVGKAGKQLDALLTLAGVPRGDVYITNTVKYRPVVRSERSIRNRTPDKREVALALPLLRAELLEIRPRLIVTLGNTPLYAVLTLAGKESRTVGTLHGSSLPVQIDSLEAALFALYHPASGIYNPKLVSVMETDARILGEQLVKAG